MPPADTASQQGWQEKLSQLDVARFPWDPKPEPQTPNQASSNAQSSGQAAGDANLASQNGSNPDESGSIKVESAKQEAGLNSNLISAYGGLDGKASVAANRAAQQLQLQYGVRAAGSINAIQDRMGQQQQQQASQMQSAQQPPSSQQPSDTASQQDPSPQPTSAVPSSTPQPPADTNTHASPQLGEGQTDGAADEAVQAGLPRGLVLPTHDTFSDLRAPDRAEIDRMLHEHINAKAKEMEAGGLMLPLKKTSRKSSAPGKRNANKRIAPYDGGDDDDDEGEDGGGAGGDVDDEDAINSELDDPDEDHEDDEVDDEGLGHIMLCMYDKVQRVKNKWCVARL